MIIFLDDDPHRAALAYQRMKPEDREKTIWCATVEEAIVTLLDYRDNLTDISFGHDFCGEKYVHTAREDCGMQIVRYLEKLAKKNELYRLKDTNWKIHTWNVDAGNLMYKRLKKIGLKVKYIPFGL